MTSECHERFSFKKRMLSLHKQESRELTKRYGFRT